MNVRELIEALELYDPEMEVGFSYNYGDYWKTQVVQTLRDENCVSEQEVKWCERLEMHEIVDEDDERGREHPDTITMVILGG